MLAINSNSLRLDGAIAVEDNFDILADEYRPFFNLRRATVFQSPRLMDLIHRRLAPNLSARLCIRVEETKLHNLTCSHSVAGSTFSPIHHRAKPLKNALQRFVRQLR